MTHTIPEVLLIAFFFRLGMYLAEFFMGLVVMMLTKSSTTKDV